MAFQFEVEIIGGMVGGGKKNSIFRVNSATIPETSVDTIEVNFKNSKVLYAGRDASGHSFTVNFWDEQGLSVYRSFQAWMMAIRNPVTGGGLNRSAYKATVIIRLLDVDESANSVVTFFNVWPSSIGDISLSYESSEKVTFDVTFAFDEMVSGSESMENAAKSVEALAKSFTIAGVGQ